MLYMPFVRADQSAIWYVQNCQPETLKKIFIINAPKAFTLVWQAYKFFLDKKTKDKVSILGSNYMSGGCNSSCGATVPLHFLTRPSRLHALGLPGSASVPPPPVSA
jgi:hypothetical protein